MTGAIVTIDAMGATPRIAQAGLERGADDRLALKANQGHLFEKAQLYFRDADQALDRNRTVDAGHGRIETRRFHDDLARLRTGHGPHNMAVVKHMALNLLNKTARTDSLKTRRKRAGWDGDDLQAVITQTA